MPPSTCLFSPASIASSSRCRRALATRKPTTSLPGTKPPLIHNALPSSSNANHLHSRLDRKRISFSSTSTSATSSASSSSPSSASSSSSLSSSDPLLDRLASTITPSTVVIVGAGIAGVATARALSLVGIDDFVVLERARGPRAEGTSIGLWTNAWRALDALRVGDELRASWPAMRGVELLDKEGKKLRDVSFEDCAGGPHEARGVGRAALVRSMAEKLPRERTFFGVSVVSARDLTATGEAMEGGDDGDRGGFVEIDVEVESGPPGATPAKKKASFRCRAAVAADGSRSTLVQKAILGSPSPPSPPSALLKPLRYAGYVAYRGIASFPETRVPRVLPRDRFRIHFGKGVRAGIVPLGVHAGGVEEMSGGGRGSGEERAGGGEGGERRALYYWFTTQNEPGADAAPKVTDVSLMRADAAKAVVGWDLPKTGIDLLQDASEDSTWSRAAISDRWLDDGKSYGAGALTAVGDAAHPMTPNTGQGGCVGLEDAVELARALGEARGEGARVLSSRLRAFERERSRRARWVQLKSFAIGFAGQLDLPLFPLLRDFLVSSVYPIEEFLDLACYDCGGLGEAGGGGEGGKRGK